MFAIVYLYWVLYTYFNIYLFFFFQWFAFLFSFQSTFMQWGKEKLLSLKSSINLSNVHLYFQKKLES